MQNFLISTYPFLVRNQTVLSFVLRLFTLSWTHYVQLIKIEDEDERDFYEIEAASNNWSVRELRRQYNAALYERVAASRDKEGVKEMAPKGQIIEKPTDI